jgi:hypothetical protein
MENDVQQAVPVTLLTSRKRRSTQLASACRPASVTSVCNQATLSQTGKPTNEEHLSETAGLGDIQAVQLAKPTNHTIVKKARR